ncbi:MAG: hypothetical protein LAN59_08915 [Acidobacteriia bacterium]|nr:hypothetical protein [Terriglobia bacterium]
MHGDAREITALVAMPRLLASLGFVVNERTRRCACTLHGGSNPSAFAWTDSGLWRCHSCGAGGDRIALIRAVRSCSFGEALRFLASLAGVEFEQDKRADTERLRQERQAEEHAADLLAHAEHGLLLELADELESLRKIWRAAIAMLEPPGPKSSIAEDGLRFACGALRRADAAYALIAFAAPSVRARFALHPELRPALIDAALEDGFVADECGYRFEVPGQ